MRKIGAHVSIVGGMELAIGRAEALGCNCVQIFSGSPRTWARSPLNTVPVEKIYSKQKELLVTPIVTHSLYLLNLAAANLDAVEKSVKALIYDMEFDALVKGGGIVVHLGSDQGRGWEAVKDQVISAIKMIITSSPNEALFLIENAAGQQGKIPSDFAQIRELLDAVNSPQLGWCLDTCHTFVAGYALGPESAKLSSKHERNGRGVTAEEAITKYDLWSTLMCVHVNDSKGEFGSGLDRHENLGEGYIPKTDLEHFLNLPQLDKKIPLILEVPGFDGNGPDAQNVALLKKSVGE